MTVRVVDPFEMIDVTEQESDVPVSPLRSRKRLFQRINEEPAVREAGDRIVERKMGNRAFQPPCVP